jgi:hypothetical protein
MSVEMTQHTEREREQLEFESLIQLRLR